MKNMHIKSTLIGTAFGLVFGFMAPAAIAAGAVIDVSELTPQTRTELEQGIRKAQTKRPAAFARVASLRLKMAELDAHKRGRLAPVSPILKGMGPDALMPMLQELALDASPQGQLKASAWRAWRLGLLEAVGALRDPRSAATMAAIVQSGAALDPPVLRAAAQALAKLNTNDAAIRLIAAGNAARGDARLAIISGMGHCRRTMVAEHLANEISGASADEALVVARALGDVANAWAWQTPFVNASGEQDAVRAVAATALVEAFARHHRTPVMRKQLTQAVLVVDHADVDKLIAKHRASASASLDAALDELSLRVANTPLHR
jgi:hypothetical protein